MRPEEGLKRELDIGDPLDWPRLKLERAHEHTVALDAEIADFLASHPYVAIAEIDPDQGCHVFRLRVRAQPPPRLGLLVGDCLHNLRSTLDHLVWQLARTTTPTPSPLTEFPLFERAAAYPPGAKGRLQHVPPAAHPLIEAMQPYHGGDFSRLRTLHTLSNIDKHRTILLCAGVALQSLAFDEVWQFASPIEELVTWRAADDGDVLVRLRYVGPAERQQELEPEFSFGVAFEQGGPGRGRPVLTTLLGMHDLIRDRVLPAFTHFFPP